MPRAKAAMNISASIRQLRPVNAELEHYRGRPVFFEPLEGNNGDKLIKLGSHILLRSLGVMLTREPKHAEVIVFNGGFAMSDIWRHALEKLKYYSRRYPDIPLMVLPSSFYFDTTDFTSLLEGRRTPVFLYARERASLKILEAIAFPCDASLGLDHDMAFYLRGTAYLQQLQSQKATEHILLVERGDLESLTGVHARPWGGVSRYLPRAVKRPLKQFVFNPLKRLAQACNGHTMTPTTTFARETLARVWAEYPQLEGLALYNADISEPYICSFQRFGQLIAKAAMVVTTRLHVAILAALLDKPTYLKSGVYHKIAGVYEHSLSGYPHVRLI
jgi:exopolysaccharide biosynthesis predicted pyruvyltransferase EpsI